MSQQFLQLVYGLAPAGTSERLAALEVRNRAVLAALAYLADDEGHGSTTLRHLEGMTLHPAELVRKSLRNLNNQGLVQVTPGRGRTTTAFQLNRGALEAQHAAHNPDPNALTQLLRYGVDESTYERIRQDRPDLRTMDDLGMEIRRFEELPAIQHRRGFHHYLAVWRVGPETAAIVMDAHRSWQSDQTVSDPTAASDVD